MKDNFPQSTRERESQHGDRERETAVSGTVEPCGACKSSGAQRVGRTRDQRRPGEGGEWKIWKWVERVALPSAMLQAAPRSEQVKTFAQLAIGIPAPVVLGLCFGCALPGFAHALAASDVLLHDVGSCCEVARALPSPRRVFACRPQDLMWLWIYVNSC